MSHFIGLKGIFVFKYYLHFLTFRNGFVMMMSFAKCTDWI